MIGQVAGEPTPQALSAAQARQFREQGYVLAPGFFDARETSAIRAEVERLKQSGKLRNVATAGDGATPSTQARNLQLCPMFRDSDLFRALPFCPKVVAAISSLIGDPFILHLDQVFLKPGGDGLGTNWHQDNAYFKIADPLGGTAMWIAVHDATIANGTLRVIPKVFRRELPHTRDPMSDHHIRCYPPPPEEAQAMTCELKAGGVAFFCYGTPHATGANTTDRERAGVAYHFLRSDAAPPDLINAGRDYRPYITGPQATGGLAEYGVKVQGTWEAQVTKALTGTAGT